MHDPARILVVDSEVIVREILVRKLRQLGYNCSSAQDGETGLLLLKSGAWDLLVTDLTVPGGGGIALMREAQHHLPDLAVILVTSVTDIETVRPSCATVTVLAHACEPRIAASAWAPASTCAFR